MIINRKYKDRLFRMVFHEKESLLELYNAIHGTTYTDTKDLEITTIQDAIYMSMKNDVSFLIRDVLNLYEHQSTVNPNMELEAAVEAAVAYCISHGIMADWLSGHRAEVMNVLLTEYDEEKHMQMERAESKAEGIAEGKIEGRIDGMATSILGLLSDMGEIPSELKAQISSQTDTQTLSQWVKAAAKSETVESFWEKIKNIHE